MITLPDTGLSALPPSDPSPPPARSAEPAITVRDVGKMYRIYDRPQDRLKQMLLWRFGRSFGHEFWALRGVSFEVASGETVGIIGRNGSGKSTLLQIIAGTLAPSEGEVAVHGRVSALLELGSGFNPEFTGRENVFLNGVILGMTSEEIAERFDDIAAFADIGPFLDQPVKLYSSGMMMRLAFAVQAQASPDVLIVDEALAVGDFAFQHKCMSKIKSLQDSGTAILLVSHDTAAIKAHCSRAVMLDGGRVFATGASDDVCVTYFHRLIETERQAAPAVPVATEAPAEARVVMREIAASTRRGLGHVQFRGIRLSDADGRETSAFRYRDWLTVELLMQAEQDVEVCYPGLLVKDLYGNYLTGITTWALGVPMPPLRKGQLFQVRFDIQLLYRPGNYSLLINNCIDNLGTDFYDWCDNVAQVTILEGDYHQPEYGYGLFGPPMRVHLNPDPK